MFRKRRDPITVLVHDETFAERVERIQQLLVTARELVGALDEASQRAVAAARELKRASEAAEASSRRLAAEKRR